MWQIDTSNMYTLVHTDEFNKWSFINLITNELSNKSHNIFKQCKVPGKFECSAK